MSNWNNFGENVREYYQNALGPKALLNNLMRYLDVFDDFTIQDLLKIYDIQVKSEIAASIIEMPEFLSHEIGLMRETGEVDTVSGAIHNLAEMVKDLSQSVSEIALSINTDAQEDV